MRLLIDECLPRALKRLLAEHTCRTVQEMGWAGKKNDLLVSLAEREFEVLITMDQGFEYQQNLGDRKIALLLLVASSNQLEDLAPLIPSALAVLHTIQPGSVIRVGMG
jgi:predicted nuclease of predicted toxin-antitoxin system